MAICSSVGLHNEAALRRRASLKKEEKVQKVAMKSSGSRHCINQVCNEPSLFSSASAQCEVAKSGDAVLYCDHEMPITSFPSSKAPKVICPVGSRRFSLVKSFNSLLFFYPATALLCNWIGFLWW